MIPSYEILRDFYMKKLRPLMFCPSGRCSCFIGRIFVRVLTFASLLIFCPSGRCTCFVLRVYAYDLSFGSLLMICPSGLCSCFLLKLTGKERSEEKKQLAPQYKARKADVLGLPGALFGRDRYRQAGTKDY